MATPTHTVTTDALATLGTIIDPTSGRDAIHLAVEPVEAGEKLYPGQHVSLKDGIAMGSGKLIGIVDPFLPGAVHMGQMFWLVVYPRQITSLRHVWEHPAFPPSGLDALPADASSAPVNLAPAAPLSDKTKSEAWMRMWAVRNMGTDYYGDGMLSEGAAYDTAIEAGHRQHVGPYESAADNINDEWWDHWETITGEKGARGSYFSCSC